ncbi:MAG: tRNA pseudouridine(54/55) synthase Pus10, partial [Phycisphaerae bacterium]
VDTGMSNAQRGAQVRQALRAAPPTGACAICHGLFGELEAWVERARAALANLEFDTLLVTSHEDAALAAREEALHAVTGADLAEPYKQEFNREVGSRLCDATGAEPDFAHPDVVVVADHTRGAVTLDVRPLFVAGRYRKLVRGLPQCRWAAWPSSIQQIVGDPVMQAAEGEDHLFHGCGREDTDVRCLGERPFVLEVKRPRRRRLDWPALARQIGESGKVQVLDLARSGPKEAARIKALRPEKTYRALVRLAEPAENPAALDRLVGKIRQQTPTRVLRRRPDLRRVRRVQSLAWRALDPRTIELEVRTEAGLYVKELVSGDGGRTRPSVAEVLGTAAECAELDVLAIHLDDSSH